MKSRIVYNREWQAFNTHLFAGLVDQKAQIAVATAATFPYAQPESIATIP
jgi:hypothetical protein